MISSAASRDATSPAACPPMPSATRKTPASVVDEENILVQPSLHSDVGCAPGVEAE